MAAFDSVRKNVGIGGEVRSIRPTVSQSLKDAVYIVCQVC